ncbi:NifB/NifX family molybdenum-iron cluster-binding protein [Bacteroidota bacterium]
MIIAFTTKDIKWDSMMDPRFGRTEYILIYDDKKKVLKNYDNRAIENEAHGAGIKTAQKLSELKPDILITGNGPGGNALSVLEKMNLKIYIGAGQMIVKDAYKAYCGGELQKV